MSTILEKRAESSEGISYRFSLPKEGLSLRGVEIEDDSPKLIFDAANCASSRTLVEEDVATIARLINEGMRPEFFYIAFPPDHPFFGRQYKYYSPQWLRGTSIGELLEQADWTMKCLSIGAKTNEDRTTFEAARNTSNLNERLGTTMDFPREKRSGSIKMSCKSIKLEETKDKLVFVGEPEMQIVHECSPAYTDYITKMYDSIAYYDESVYLRMPEMIKLILTMEYLKEQGFDFDREWYMNQTNKKKPKSKAIKTNDSDILDFDFRNIPKNIPPDFNKMFQVAKSSKTGVCFVEKNAPENTLAFSVNNNDMLYHGSDPKEPLHADITPDVETWSELYSETVPWPHVWNLPLAIFGLPTAMGGVTTSSIPKSNVSNPAKNTSKATAHTSVKREAQYEYRESDGSLSVSPTADKSASKKKPRNNMIPKSKIQKAPQQYPIPNTKESQLRRAMEDAHAEDMYGYEDEGSMKMFDSNGTKVMEGDTLKAVGQRRDQNGDIQRLVMKLPLPPVVSSKAMDEMSTSSVSDSGIASSPSQLSVNTTDTGFTDTGDDGCSSPPDSGQSTPQFSPGSSDKAD